MLSLKILLSKIKDGTIKEMWEELMWIMSYTKNYKKEILFYIFLGIFSSVLTLMSSVFSKNLIDVVINKKVDQAPLMAILMILMSLFSMLFHSFMSRLTLKINIRIQNDIQSDIFEKIMNVNWYDLSKYSSGDLLNRFTSDVSTVASSAIGWLPNFIIALFNLVATLILISYYDATMMVLTLINAPIMLIASRYMMEKMRYHSEEVKKMNSEMMGFQAETFHNIDSIKSFHLNDLFLKRLKNKQSEFKEINLRYNEFSIKSNIVLSIIGMVIQYSYLCWAVFRLWMEKITVAELTFFMQNASRISNAFNTLVKIVPTTITSTTSAKRIIELLELEKENYDEKLYLELLKKVEHGFSIELKDACFAYQKGHDVLLDSSLSASPREIVALIGPSGEGKTTLIRMFLGLIRPTSGEAVLKDHTNTRIPLDISTRSLFAYVPQGNTIFSGSIAENLRMVKNDASDEEIVEALKKACAYEFVEKMEHGINSYVGARGKGLSEGQAQRIAIARALLLDAPILLLDEATSALDVATERQVLKNIMSHRSHKTVIVTTHRPSVLDMCQKIYRVVDTKLTLLDEEESSSLAMEF